MVEMDEARKAELQKCTLFSWFLSFLALEIEQQKAQFQTMVHKVRPEMGF